MFTDTYKGKRVLITGNTGFKGSWLSIWLLSLGARVFGISKDIPTNPSIFESLKLNEKIDYRNIDILHHQALSKAVEEIRPDFIFHLAAQPIVSLAYEQPLETMQVNIIGTANLLQAMRGLQNPCTAVFISSDKCYENLEWSWGYRENDRLGGKDPYSASKGACELIIHSFYYSYFRDKMPGIGIASARAGNVIGGGDWALDRIIPDAIRSWMNRKPVVLRNPSAVRPWQHVLEPLGGYLRLGQLLAIQSKFRGESYNFGPGFEKVYSVSNLLDNFAKAFRPAEVDAIYTIDESRKFHEAGYLKLNCDKALADLHWQPVLDLSMAVNMTAVWYDKFYSGKTDMFDFTNSQIREYFDLAGKKNLNWISNT